MGFSTTLIEWQKKHGRHDLPWQNTQDPYRIWVSEIMLQQTQVNTVRAYYQRFMHAFPNVKILAEATLDDVLALWSGLGYYRRARHLHAAACRVHAWGTFPSSATELMTLPGIGRSTAAAIAAFAYGQRCAILDGNVKRVLTRYFALTDPPLSLLWNLAEQLLPTQDIASYTQGLMDLGSMICTRTNPGCSACPFHASCRAWSSGIFHAPVSTRARMERPIWRSYLLLIQNQDGAWLMIKRPPSGVWAGLWSFPEECSDEGKKPGHSLGLDLVLASDPATLPPFRHLLTHRTWHFQPLLYRIDAPLPGESLAWFQLADIAALAIPTPVRRLLPQLSSFPGE